MATGLDTTFIFAGWAIPPTPSEARDDRLVRGVQGIPDDTKSVSLADAGFERSLARESRACFHESLPSIVTHASISVLEIWY
ncbi:hypothetical protein [Thiocystis violacea]|uniref:hypothetical protein n=1 Tax=Thiocystis violacea TaxID=13725 RepID=UPI0019071DC6|nr:hypothetical protein [Thiocystis violacea]MBK1717537.1 hypothetical protein [Thiocystis violacea]